MKKIYYPESVEEALAAMDECGKDAVPLGGATSFIFGHNRPSEGIIDLAGAGLDYIDFSVDAVRIGAGVNMDNLDSYGAGGGSPEGAPALPDALREAASSIGTTQLRNMITVGGNVSKVFAWSDLPPVLLALDAMFIAASIRGERGIRASEFFSKQPRKLLHPGELVKEVILAPQGRWYKDGVKSSQNRPSGSAFMKFNRIKREFSMVSVAVAVSLENDIITDASIAVGGLVPLPVRLKTVEKEITGKKSNEPDLSGVASLAASSVHPMKDRRAGRKYRAGVAGTLVARALSEALRRANGQKSMELSGSADGQSRDSMNPGPPDDTTAKVVQRSHRDFDTIRSTKSEETVTFKLNGVNRSFQCDPAEPLLDLLRREGYTGAKKGCDDGSCGACTVIMDGQTVLSCILPAGIAAGREITTIEGLGTVNNPHPIQKAMVDAGGVQCGYCTPGMVLSIKALLDKNSNPDDSDIRRALDGNLCRCTGYVKILDGARKAAELQAGTGEQAL